MQQVQILKTGQKYIAHGQDALLISNKLRLSFFTKKVAGKCLHTTTFHKKHLGSFRQKLRKSGISISVQ